MTANRFSDTAFFGHPRGLGWLAAADFWERFSYYGMQALLVLYLSHRLLLPGHVEQVLGFTPLRRAIEMVYGPLTVKGLASVIFGLYAGLVYVTPIAGGLLADRVLGLTRTVTAGALLMASGHFLMAFDASFLPALLCLLVGAGCFRGNLVAQIGGLYEPGDSRAATAFQLYYIVGNLAVIFAPLVCGTLGERLAYHWGFGAAGVGMLIGLSTYLKGRVWLPEQQSERRGDARMRQSLLPGDARKLLKMLSLLPVIGLALANNQQGFNVYLLWAESSYRLVVFAQPLPVSWLISMGTAIAVATITCTVLFWRWWRTRWVEPDEITKMALGTILMAAAPVINAVAAHLVAVTGERVSLGWAVLSIVINDFGYANLVPVALSLYSRAAPKAIGGMIVGLFFLSFFFANMLVGWLGGLLEKLSGPQFWLLHAALVLIAAVMLFLARGMVRQWLVPAAGGSP